MDEGGREGGRETEKKKGWSYNAYLVHVMLVGTHYQ